MNVAGMVRRPPVLIGVAIGLAGALGILIITGGGLVPSAKPLRGPLLSECDGSLRQLVIHYTTNPEAVAAVLPTYQGFLPQLQAGVTVHVVCPDKAAYEDLVARVGPTKCTLSPVVVNHIITPWARDRWLAFGPLGQRTATLVYPRGENAAKVWPPRRGSPGSRKSGRRLGASRDCSEKRPVF